MGMVKRYTKHVHVKMTDELYDKTVKLADKLYEGNIAMLIRKLVEEKYDQVFGKTGDRA
jgi:hypothetical protein